MKAQFLSYIAQHLPFIQHKKLLLAVSGGLDSMVLFALCKELEMDIAVAHCNFNLRGKESDTETAFVEKTMRESQIPVFIKHFDTYAYAKMNKVSTQMAARDLRYTWFQELAAENDFDYILTAHHSNDAAETFLINLSRGTGIKGLTGIPEHNGNLVRPLLRFSRKQIHEYALANNLQWREDSSNASDAYLRNHLRHNAILALENATPHFLDGLSKTQEHLKQSAALLSVYESQLEQEYTYPINSISGPSGICLDLIKIKDHKAPKAVIYALLKEYGFTSWEDIYDLVNAQSGKKVFAPKYYVLKDRDVFQVMPISDSVEEDSISWILQDEETVHFNNGQLSISQVAQMQKGKANEIYVDKDRLNFPLHIRKWKHGDFFHPLGMKGTKKLSKYFKDEKLSLIEKERIYVLCNDTAIIWVIGMRPDNRFRVTETTKTILKISYNTYEK